MILLIIFVALAFALILVLWGGSMLLQGWLYQAPADRMPIRAAAAGGVLALFLTGWCAIDRANPKTYDTLFEFTHIETAEFDAFEAVMKDARGREKNVAYRRTVPRRGNSADFVTVEVARDGKRHTWERSRSDAVCVALLIQEEGKPGPTRFNGNFDKDGNFDKEFRYTDDDGRYILPESLGQIHRRKFWMLVKNVLLNMLHFALWWMALWLALRFDLWHAFGLALVLWLFTMIALQPLLFNQARPKEVKTAMLAIETFRC